MTTVYMNLYKQGWYHRAGKPRTLSIHPGDLYETRAAAVADIDPAAPYVGTVAVELGSIPFVAYEDWSIPVPLYATRKRLEHRSPSQIVGMRPLLADPLTQAYAQRFDAIAEAEQAAVDEGKRVQNELCLRDQQS